MKKEEIRNVTILGSGTMGQEIGLLSAICGYQVTMYDISEDSLQTARRRQLGHLQMMNKTGYLSSSENESVLAGIRYTTDPAQAAREAHLVSESVPETVSVKEEIYRKFSGLWPEGTILTTNTSTLLPSMFAQATGRPEKFMALHFHPHVWISNVADVMPHPGTDPGVVQTVTDFAVSIRQIPVPLHKESPGYVFNAMLVPLLNSALNLAANGVASPEDVDRAFMGILKTRQGPMGMIDLIGLDTVYHVTKTNMEMQGTQNNPQLQKLVGYVKARIDEGKLGIKSGSGFYDYPNPSYAKPDFTGLQGA